MEFDALVAEIAARVTQRLQGLDVCRGKPKLLVLSQGHGEKCHALLENSRICGRFETKCALIENYDCDVGEFSGIVLFNLTNDALAKAAAGICDTPYTRLLSTALLKGVKIWAADEEIELLSCAGLAETPYTAMLRDKLGLLEKSGLIVCAANDLEETILGSCGCGENAVSCSEESKRSVAPDSKREERELSLTDKRVITEKSIVDAHISGITVIRVGARSILTDLARDYAHERKIRIVRG